MSDFFQQIQELVSNKKLQKAYETLSARYRFESDKELQTDDELLAYMVCRMPATFAVCCEVFKRLKEVMPSITPKSVLDVGSGPATAILALLEAFDALDTVTMCEKVPGFIDYARMFLSDKINGTWCRELPEDESFDLVIASYMLSEQKDDSMLEKIESLASSCIVFIDTGTPQGYSTLMKARDYLIANGWYIRAPCPHQKACPLDWCHFSCRLPRTRLHKQVKGTSLGYEDEKFCYLIASKDAGPTYDRIVSTPLKRSGHVHVRLCTSQGREEDTLISKKMGIRYKQAKKAEWGDML